jgi:hypothetical protein
MTSPRFHIIVGESTDNLFESIVKEIGPDKTSMMVEKLRFSRTMVDLHKAQTPLLVINLLATNKFWDKLEMLRECMPHLHIIYKCDKYKSHKFMKSVTSLPMEVTHIDYSCDIPRKVQLEDAKLLFPDCSTEDFERYTKDTSPGDFLHRDPDGTMCIYNGTTRRELPPKDPLADLVAQLKVLLERLDQVVTKPDVKPVNVYKEVDSKTGGPQPFIRIPETEKDKKTGGLLPEVRIPEYNMDKRIPTPTFGGINGQSSWSSFGDL